MEEATRRLAPRSVPTPAAVEQALAAASVDDEVPDDELEEEEERDINGDDVKSVRRRRTALIKTDPEYFGFVG